MKEVSDIYARMVSEYKIDIDSLKDLSRSEETFKFALDHQGENFNDLYERLDD